ncbi:MAG: TolC family protein [Oligoflexia bacterium]|nr:TolC family protein [Oligoflexia bacterium]
MKKINLLILLFAFLGITPFNFSFTFAWAQQDQNRNLNQESDDLNEQPITTNLNMIKNKSKNKSKNKIDNSTKGDIDLENLESIEEGGVKERAQDSYVLGLSKNVTLRGMLEQGLRENPQEKIRQYQKYIVEIASARNNDKFWYPQIGLVMKTENQRIARLLSKDNLSTSRSTPDGYIGLEFGEYTVFNWGKDYAKYLNVKEENQRKSENLFDQRRNLKLNLISLYFELIKLKLFERIAQDYVRNSTFVYRIGREKVTLKKISEQQYYQSRTQYLIAQQQYNEARVNTKNFEKTLSYILGEEPFTTYKPEEYLRYKKINMTLDQAVNLYQENSALIKDKMQALTAAHRNFEIAFKENLPLPKFSINFGSYLHTFSSSGAKTMHTTSEYRSDGTLLNNPGGSNIELRASINMSWDILGTEGLFNGRKRSEAFYEKTIAKIDYDNSKKYVDTNIRKLLEVIVELEKEMTIVTSYVANARKEFNQTLENYLAQKTSFLEIKDALLTLKNAEELMEGTKFRHLKAKLDLAEEMGVEDFPGDNFEILAVREEK